jgi:release factor glutamine methyltransferase
MTAAAAPACIDALLAEARALGLDRLDAQLLLAQHLQRPRAWVIAHGDSPLDDVLADKVRADFARRADGVPLAYLSGWREFYGLSLQIGPAVLDPRPDTETLVDWALELLAGELAGRAAPQVADLGTGSGAIALAIAQRCPRAQVHAVEASADALALARANGLRLGLPVRWLAGHWWAPLAGLPLDLALSNPPYIAEGDPHLPALRHEPRLALVAGSDGLAALREIVTQASAHLHSGGWLLLEHGHDQAEAVRGLLAAAGFERVRSRRDLAGVERCSGGCRPQLAVAPATRSPDMD